MVFKATIALALIPAVAVAQICTDNPTFEFTLDNGNPGDCEWLTLNNPANRVSKYCGRGHVKGACSASCGFCPCEDNSGFKFNLENGNEQNCAWFLLRNTDTRRLKYCYAADGGGESASAIGNECVAACNFCIGGTDTGTPFPTGAPVTSSPAKAPTSIPTVSPTSANSTPSASPTRPPSPMPSPFPTLRPTLEPSDSPSETPSEEPSISPTSMPSDSPSQQPSEFPSDSPSDMPSTSNMPSDDLSIAPSSVPSDQPSISPSAMPSDQPSRSPSDQPSVEPSGVPSDSPTNNPSSEPSTVPTNNPTTSIKPSATPTVSPSKSPALIPTSLAPTKSPTQIPTESLTSAPPSSCADNDAFKFTLDNGSPGDCEWLTLNNPANRISKYCGRGHIKGACPASCGFCPCGDNSGFKFDLENGKEQNCAWFLLNNTSRRRLKYCYAADGKSASAIGNECVAACNFCSSSSGLRFRHRANVFLVE